MCLFIGVLCRSGSQSKKEQEAQMLPRKQSSLPEPDCTQPKQNDHQVSTVISKKALPDLPNLIGGRESNLKPSEAPLHHPPTQLKAQILSKGFKL